MRSSHPHATSMPDPNDRTPNDPAVLVSSAHLRQYLETISYTDPDSRAAALTYADEARKYGWDAMVLGSSVLLQVTVTLSVRGAFPDSED